MVPLVTYDTQTDFDLWYGPGGYSRAWATDQYGHLYEYLRRRDALIGLGMQSADRILIAGAGLGFLPEVFRQADQAISTVAYSFAAHPAPFLRVAAIELSAHIRGHVDYAAGVVTVAEDIRNLASIQNDMRRAQRDMGLVGQAANGRWDWIVTEDVLAGFTDLEVVEALNACDVGLEAGRPLSAVVHLVHPPPYEPAGVLNEKTMNAWKALRPLHTWMPLPELTVV